MRPPSSANASSATRSGESSDPPENRIAESGARATSRTISEEFRAAVAEHGKVRALVRMRRIPRMGLGAWVEDLKLTPYARNVERYAIVSDSNLFGWAAKIGGVFIGKEVKHFEDSRYEEA